MMKTSLIHMDQFLHCCSCGVCRACQSGYAAETFGLSDGKVCGSRKWTAPH